MKKALLFANVGSDTNGYFHVGDEAMFWETVRFYRLHFPKVQLSSLVSLQTTSKGSITQQQGLGWPDKKRPALIYLIKLLFKTWIFAHFRLSLFTPEQAEFVQLIERQDLIHFVGGGNLTSECGHWFYYALLVAGVSNLLRKPVVLSSQTIGPFSTFLDKKLCLTILSKAVSVTLRSADHHQQVQLVKAGLKCPVIRTSLDAAYFLNPEEIKEKKLKHSPATLRIGISLHTRGNNQSQLQALLRTVVEKLLESDRRIELILLPHIFNRAGEFDSLFLSSITQHLPATVSLIEPNFFSKERSPEELSQFVKGLTGTCDFVLSSRYHGLIFALSQSIPCISLTDGKYQTMKNIDALRFLFPRTYKHFAVELNHPKAFKQLVTATGMILRNQVQLQHRMKLRNTKLMRLRWKNERFHVHLIQTLLCRR